MSFAKAGAHTSSSAEDHSAETAKRKREVNAANHRHSDEVRPDDGKIGTAIQNRLREGDEMWGWAVRITCCSQTGMLSIGVAPPDRSCMTRSTGPRAARTGPW